MKFKSVIALFLVLASLFVFSSCNDDSNLSAISNAPSQTSSDTASGSDSEVGISQIGTDEQVDFKQLDPPEAGEEIAVLTTSMGTIKIRLFPDDAPKAVENFKGLINSGYYNGVTFHRVINDFMIQSGDPTGTGAGGESIWGEDFEIELPENLFNFRGALSMANTGLKDSNGSQFFIVQSPTVTEDTFTRMSESGFPVESIPQSVIDKYLEVGGQPSLDFNRYPKDFLETYELYGYTVFGQVFEGMDVVDAIAGVEVEANPQSGEESVPVTPVTIDKAEIVVYEG